MPAAIFIAFIDKNNEQASRKHPIPRTQSPTCTFPLIQDKLDLLSDIAAFFSILRNQCMI